MNEVELALAYRNLQELTSFVAMTLIGVGIALALLPVGSCDRCAHCRQERLAQHGTCPQHGKPYPECRDEHRP